MNDKPELKHDVPTPVNNLEERTQAGLKILVGNCPRCGVQMAVDGPGKRPCHCGQMLQYGG